MIKIRYNTFGRTSVNINVKPLCLNFTLLQLFIHFIMIKTTILRNIKVLIHIMSSILLHSFIQFNEKFAPTENIKYFFLILIILQPI